MPCIEIPRATPMQIWKGLASNQEALTRYCTTSEIQLIMRVNDIHGSQRPPIRQDPASQRGPTPKLRSF